MVSTAQTPPRDFGIVPAAKRVVNPGFALLVVAIILLAINLRSPVVAIAPVIRDIQADLGLSAAVAGLFTSLPVLCFGLATPIAVIVIRKLGAEWAVLVCLSGVFVGTLLRSVGPAWLALSSTIIIGLAITIGNVVVPVIIRREVTPQRAGLVTGTYTAAINIGTMLVTLGTAPLASIFGWRIAIASWAVLVLVAAAVWVAHSRRPPKFENPNAVAEPMIATRALWRNASTWLLVICFSGQAFSYYSLTTWLPTLLADERGFSPEVAGGFSSIYQICAVIGALGVPLLAFRVPVWSTIVLIGVLWSTMPLGLLFAPDQFLLWSITAGIAQGGGLTAVLAIIIRVGRSQRESTFISALVQGCGYVVAASGPPIIGAVHDATSSWSAPLIIVVGAVTTFTVFGIISAIRADRRTASATPASVGSA
jgi:CP family cyanate transporter-like MFS transporter